MKRLSILFIILFSHLLINQSFAQKEARIILDFKGVNNTDSVTLSWGTFNKPSSPLILQVNANEKQAIRIPLNEPRLIIVGLNGYVGGYELLASPDEEITLSGRIHKDKSARRPTAEFSKMSVSGAAWQAPYRKAMAYYLYSTLIVLRLLSAMIFTTYRILSAKQRPKKTSRALLICIRQW